MNKPTAFQSEMECLRVDRALAWIRRAQARADLQP